MHTSKLKIIINKKSAKDKNPANNYEIKNNYVHSYCTVQKF